MAVEAMSQQDIQIFSRKLEEFGNSLPESEQKLFAEILLRAASAGEDVEGHALHIGTSWTHVRHQLRDILADVLETMGAMAPYEIPTP